LRCKAHARLDAHRSRWVAGAARRWCGVHGQAGKVLVLAERSAASAQRCRQRVACASFPERALIARGAQRNFCGANCSQRVVSAMQVCSGTDLAPARSAGTESVQQANAARKSRAWCTLEARGELLAACFCWHTVGMGLEPTSAQQLLAATSAQPPPCACFRAHEPPFSLHFQLLFCLTEGPL